MTNQEILKKAIRKAIDGGYKVADCETPRQVLDWFEVGSMSTNFDNYKLFIFNHDFAKALWGEEKQGGWFPGAMKPDDTHALFFEPWAYHLQQMVIAEDPINYLADNM